MNSSTFKVNEKAGKTFQRKHSTAGGASWMGRVVPPIPLCTESARTGHSVTTFMVLRRAHHTIVS
jgi:hypothetical protein